MIANIAMCGALVGLFGLMSILFYAVSGDEKKAKKN